MEKDEYVVVSGYHLKLPCLNSKGRSGSYAKARKMSFVPYGEHLKGVSHRAIGYASERSAPKIFTSSIHRI